MRWAIARPAQVAVVWLAVLGAAAFGVATLEIDTTTDSVLDRSAEPWAFYQQSQELFGSDEIVVVALAGKTPFDPAVLAEVGRLADVYRRLPGVRRVDSLASVPLIRSQPDGRLDLSAALSRGVPDDAEARRRWVASIRNDRLAPRSLVSEDGRIFALNVILEHDFTGYDALVGAIGAELPEQGARMSGVPVFRSEANARTRREILTFVPLTVLMIGALLRLVFRSLRAVAVAVGVGATGTVVVVGAMGLLGTPLSLITMILPSVTLAFGCSYVMHVLSAAAGARDPAQLQERLRPIALPVALSGLTTAIGFAVIGAVRIEEVRHVGVFGAIGVLGLVAATLTIAPAVLARWPLPAHPPRLAGFAAGALRRRLLAAAVGWGVPLALAWTVVLGVFAVGVTHLEVETDATRWFPPGNPVRDDYEGIRADLSGISPINVVLRASEGARVTEPDALRAIDALAAHLEARPDVGKAISIADPLRQLHGGFVNDPARPLPDGEALVDQYLLLLEGEEEIADLVTRDRTAANIVIRANDNGSEALLAIGTEASRFWQERGVADIEPRTTGIMYEFARAEDEIAMGQLRGLGLALLAIATVLLGALRRPSLALVSVVPNVVPIVMVFGFMGWSGIPLDAGTVIVGSLALGIAVDDTIHLVSAFRDARNAGTAPRLALDGAIRRVAHPLILTTLAVGLGFALLGLSQFTFTRNLGLLIAGTMTVCLLADLALLPALLWGTDPGRRPGSSEAPN